MPRLICVGSVHSSFGSQRALKHICELGRRYHRSRSFVLRLTESTETSCIFSGRVAPVPPIGGTRAGSPKPPPARNAGIRCAARCHAPASRRSSVFLRQLPADNPTGPDRTSASSSLRKMRPASSCTSCSRAALCVAHEQAYCTTAAAIARAIRSILPR